VFKPDRIWRNKKAQNAPIAFPNIETAETIMRAALSVTAILTTFIVCSVNAGDNMKAFPSPDNGQIRYVIQLAEKDDESNYQVELIVGQTVRIDKTNQYFFGGQIKKDTIVGWGFTRYVVDELGPMAGTLMAVNPNAPKVDRFIRLGGEPYLIRYNSRLPVVVYVPEGVEARYRIWRAEPESKEANEG
jgi:ecotin